MTKNDGFFNKQSEASKVKTRIVSKYFAAWSKIMLGIKKRTGREQKIGYFELFSGPGVYGDGSESTPVKIITQAVSDPGLKHALVSWFIDKDQDHILNLEKHLKAIDGYNLLAYKPLYISQEVNDELTKYFQEKNLISTLLFIDPWGYKGLTKDLIKSVVKDWGSDCIFFFNYARITGAISNPKQRENMNLLFGEDVANKLGEAVKEKESFEKVKIIMDGLKEAFHDLVGSYVLPFAFFKGNKLSHHLIFLTKSFTGYEAMKNSMAKECYIDKQGVPSFVHYTGTEPLFHVDVSETLAKLKIDLLQGYCGQTMSFDELYERDSIGKVFVKKNYRAALKALEKSGAITCSSVDNSKSRKRPTGTYANHVRIRFPDGS